MLMVVVVVAVFMAFDGGGGGGGGGGRGIVTCWRGPPWWVGHEIKVWYEKVLFGFYEEKKEELDNEENGKWG